MKPVSLPMAMWGWLSRMSRSMVEPERIEPTTKTGPGPVSVPPAVLTSDPPARGGLRRHGVHARAGRRGWCAGGDRGVLP